MFDGEVIVIQRVKRLKLWYNEYYHGVKIEDIRKE